MSDIQRWADKAMFAAAPIDATAGPKVRLLWMTPDPLGAIAATCKMYKGEVADSLANVTDAERREYLEQVQHTKLQAPFEFVQFHFLLEGVTRAFTHQLVRQRTATYAQESLRFAVKGDMPVGLPPSLAGTTGDFDHFTAWADESWATLPTAEKMRCKWDACVRQIHSTYQALINMGMPAEDARGLLPHNVLTRVHYTTDLRALLDHAGNRLCTQAQFEWRAVFARIVEAIRTYDPYPGLAQDCPQDAQSMYPSETNAWQFEELSKLFKPVCYQTGRCEFKANFDRPCAIRERVDAFEAARIPSNGWHSDGWVDAGRRPLLSIQPAEWLANPGAAR